MDVWDYEVLQRLSMMRVENGVLPLGSDRKLAELLNEWDRYVDGVVAQIKEAFQVGSRYRMMYKLPMTGIGLPGERPDMVPINLVTATFDRSEMCDREGNIDNVSVRLAASRFCKEQMEKLMKG